MKRSCSLGEFSGSILRFSGSMKWRSKTFCQSSLLDLLSRFTCLLTGEMAQPDWKSTVRNGTRTGLHREDASH